MKGCDEKTMSCPVFRGGFLSLRFFRDLPRPSSFAHGSQEEWHCVPPSEAALHPWQDARGLQHVQFCRQRRLEGSVRSGRQSKSHPAFESGRPAVSSASPLLIAPFKSADRPLHEEEEEEEAAAMDRISEIGPDQ